MRVILTDDVVGVGDIGEQINVKPGFARNYLVPRGLAIEAGSKNAAEVAHRMRQIEAKKRRLKGGAEELSKRLTEITISLELRVGAGGRVFGSVSTRDIVRELAARGYEIDRRRVLMEEPIKRVGAHKVRVKLHPEVVSEVHVEVKAAEATKEEEEKAAEELRENLEAAAAAQQEAAPAEEAPAAEEKPKAKAKRKSKKGEAEAKE